MNKLTALEFINPLAKSHQADDLEAATVSLIAKLIHEFSLDELNDMHNYGIPWQGGRTVLERFSKLNGLVILRQDEDGLSDDIMAMILANWQSMASERGLAFLQFVLDMLFPRKNRILRLWHSKALVDTYPKNVTERQLPGTFLTSRVRIALTLDSSNSDITEIAPILQKLVPWHIVPEIAVSIEFKDINLGAAMVGMPYHVAYLSPY
ncbi:hypothetical protein [Psychrobacter sp.]|uniref:hypothetical protein n=1 Tax=Psychrobacter sp. TaxID=56811 RepID=UPI0025F70710|nr:hypothetical protein [Psychrobacter sp.]